MRRLIAVNIQCRTATTGGLRVRKGNARDWILLAIVIGVVSLCVACMATNSASRSSDGTTPTVAPAVATKPPPNVPANGMSSDIVTDPLPTDESTDLPDVPNPDLPGHVDVGGCIGGKHLHICIGG